MLPRNRPARIAAAVGATLAAGAVSMLAVTTTASADEPGRCLQNVNIREEPDAESRIVALCEAGTKVDLGEERDGFVRIDELGGWAAKDYVKADETSSSEDRSDSDSHSDSDDERSGDSHGGDSHGDAGRHSSHGDEHRSSTGDSGSGDSDAGHGEHSSDAATDGDGAQLDGLLS